MAEVYIQLSHDAVAVIDAGLRILYDHAAAAPPSLLQQLAEAAASTTMTAARKALVLLYANSAAELSLDRGRIGPADEFALRDALISAVDLAAAAQ